MIELGVHACTDITGFGLAGHASHLVQEGTTGIEIDFETIPYFPEVMDLLKKKVYPGGLGRNRDFYSPVVEFKADIPEYERDILFDPQTSGGLLIVLDPEGSRKLVDRLHESGIDAVIIGRVIEHPEHKIVVK